MYEKIIYINPVSKLTPYIKEIKKEVVQDDNRPWNIDISSIFWNKLFYSDEFINRDNIVVEWEFLGWDRIETAVNLFRNVEKTIPDSKEMVFVYDTFMRIINEFNRVHSQWHLSISHGLSHSFSDFNCQQINLTRLESAISDWWGVVWDMLHNIVDECNIFDSIIVFKFFWPTDILQLFFISEKLKAQNNIIIVDLTQANEQSDFSQWVQTFAEDSHARDLFDYMIVYEDFWLAFKKLLKHIRSWENKIPSPESFSNIVYFKDKKAHFTKSHEIDPEELFNVFVKYHHNPDHVSKVNNFRSVHTRLFPYKCYWSSCFFCTINSTNPYKYQKENHRYIEACVDFLEDNNIRQISLGDEAIHVDDILLFSRMIIERKIDIIFRFRTRFDFWYTEDVCKILAQAWARFCGIWLECASDKVSNFVNKWSDMTIKDKMNIIANFDKAGIPFHNYSIFWLPSETIDESYETFVFLKKNIELRNNYTCTPNLFGLNKGSVFHRNPEKFWLKLMENTSRDILLNVASTFLVDRQTHQKRLKYISDIHAFQFLSFYNPMKVEKLSPVWFWEFIDRSNVYYTIKTLSNKQPFRYPKRNPINIQEISDSLYEFGKYIEWIDVEKWWYFMNITNGYSVFIPLSEWKNIWQKWMSNKSISENIVILHWTWLQPEIIQTIVANMILYEILVPIKTNMAKLVDYKDE